MKSAFVAPNSIWRELDLRNINQRKQIRQDGTNTNDLKNLKRSWRKKHKKVGRPLFLIPEYSDSFIGKREKGR